MSLEQLHSPNWLKLEPQIKAITYAHLSVSDCQSLAEGMYRALRMIQSNSYTHVFALDKSGRPLGLPLKMLLQELGSTYAPQLTVNFLEPQEYRMLLVEDYSVAEAYQAQHTYQLTANSRVLIVDEQTESGNTLTAAQYFIALAMLTSTPTEVTNYGLPRYRDVIAAIDTALVFQASGCLPSWFPLSGYLTGVVGYEDTPSPHRLRERIKHAENSPFLVQLPEQLSTVDGAPSPATLNRNRAKVVFRKRLRLLAQLLRDAYTQQ